MKTILLTGATDGIGLQTAKMFAKDGYNLFLHGRDKEKLMQVKKELNYPDEKIKLFVADFSRLYDVSNMANEILQNKSQIDVLINNAGVFVVPNQMAITVDNLDIRFSVNTIAPYILTKKCLPLFNSNSRVINLASAAQMPVDFDALKGNTRISESDAYAQSKLALIMWTMQMAKEYSNGPTFISVNPKSFLGSKMVKEAYGRQGYDLRIGANILYRAALSDEFKNANGKYFDNDYEMFNNPHPFALDEYNRLKLIDILDNFIL